METNLLYILIALNVAVLAFCIFFAVRLNFIKYLLEQPAVQKISPKLKLRPYKPKESDKEVTTSGPAASAHSRPRSGGNKSRERSSSNRDRSSRQRTQQRGPRSRGPRSQFPNRSEAQGNGTREQSQGNEPRNASPKQESQGPSEPQGAPAGESKGRRPLTQVGEAPQPQPQAQPQKSNHRNEHRNESSDQESIRHGRRTRVKKAPTFEE